MSLLALPADIFLRIIDHLSPETPAEPFYLLLAMWYFEDASNPTKETNEHLSHFARTCRPIYSVANPILYHRNARLALIWAAHTGAEAVARKALDGPFAEQNDYPEEGMLVGPIGAALGLAASGGYPEVVKALLEDDRLVDPNIPRLEDKTPLAMAIYNGSIEVVKLSVQDSRVDLEAQDEMGDTPLILAARKGYWEIADLLLERGADTAAINVEGCSASHWRP